MKKILVLLLCLLCMTGCSKEKDDSTYTVGLCNYVDDASLNQIVENIEERLKQIEAEEGVTLNVRYDNANADANVLSQIVANFLSEDADLMIAVATPVAMTMQAAAEDTDIPIVFAAVSEPKECGLVEDPDHPEANITGTSDHLDTASITKLMLTVDPDMKKVGLLYDLSQDASTASIREAKEFFQSRNIEVIEKTGTDVSEIMLAAQALADEKVDAVFTPTDNTVMQSELAIAEIFTAAQIPHFAGADAFALNGAFLGYGVNYENLGIETAEMVKEILVDKKEISSLPVRTFDNGIATINTDTCELLGLDIEEIRTTLTPYCSAIVETKTAESFE